MSRNEVVLVIDFGSTYNQLLTRKIRELGVFSELRPHTITVDEAKKINPKAIILSGGPYYINDEFRYRIDEGIFSLGIPIRSEEHTSELQSRGHIVCRLLLEKKN